MAKNPFKKLKDMSDGEVNDDAAKATGTAKKKTTYDRRLGQATTPSVEYKAGTEGPKSTSPTKKGAEFVPPDGRSADYWMWKMYNSPNQPGFDPNKMTVSRDPFGDESITDTNDVPPELFNYKPGDGFQQAPNGRVTKGRDVQGQAPTQPEGVVPIPPATGGEFGQQFQSGTVPAAAQGQLPPQVMQLIAQIMSGGAQGQPQPQAPTDPLQALRALTG